MLKEMDADAIVDAIKVVAKGGSYLHPKVTKNLVAEFRRLSERENKGNFHQTEIRRPFHLLTKRECEVLQLLTDGQSNRTIGETLFISEKTVKNHVSSILTKNERKRPYTSSSNSNQKWLGRSTIIRIYKTSCPWAERIFLVKDRLHADLAKQLTLRVTQKPTLLCANREGPCE